MRTGATGGRGGGHEQRNCMLGTNVNRRETLGGRRQRAGDLQIESLLPGSDYDNRRGFNLATISTLQVHHLNLNTLLLPLTFVGCVTSGRCACICLNICFLPLPILVSHIREIYVSCSVYYVCLLSSVIILKLYSINVTKTMKNAIKITSVRSFVNFFYTKYYGILQTSHNLFLLSIIVYLYYLLHQTIFIEQRQCI